MCLVVKVVENPIINRIAFEGNKRLETKVLEAEIQLRPRVVYTRARVQNAVNRILELYRRNGRYAAKVEPKIIELDQNRVDLVFEINEGPTTGVGGINFIGNEQFSDSTLRGVMQTSESAWYRFLSTDDTYDPDRVTFDEELLRRFYTARGYADFQVVSAVAELTPGRRGVLHHLHARGGPAIQVRRDQGRHHAHRTWAPSSCERLVDQRDGRRPTTPTRSRRPIRPSPTRSARWATRSSTSSRADQASRDAHRRH